MTPAPIPVKSAFTEADRLRQKLLAEQLRRQQEGMMQNPKLIGGARG